MDNYRELCYTLSFDYWHLIGVYYQFMCGHSLAFQKNGPQ